MLTREQQHRRPAHFGGNRRDPQKGKETEETEAEGGRVDGARWGETKEDGEGVGGSEEVAC